ncbi:MAG: 3-oxoacyl-ACP synthase, partial [Acidobacteriota bacterium]
MKSPGFRSLSVSFPETIRTNDFYLEHHAELVARAEEKSLAKMWAAHGGEQGAFDLAFKPFRTDPFRGTVERRILGKGEPILPLEVQAAREAIAAAGLDTSDIDIVLSCSFQPDRPGIGHAVFLARELGIRGAAWNIESACSSASVCFQLASSLITSGQGENVLVVISCSYSKVSDPQDTFGWFLG